jgi:hypothetical protein
MTVTPNAGGGGGTFTPVSVVLTTAAPSATFTYTPSFAGTKTISCTNDKGLTNPAGLIYTVSFSPADIPGLQAWWKADALALADGASVSTWPDSSGNGHNATQTGTARPTFRVSGLNGRPAVRFAVISTQFLNVAPPLVVTPMAVPPVPWTSFAVMQAITGVNGFALCSSVGYGLFTPLIAGDGKLKMCDGSGNYTDAGGPVIGAGAHVFSGHPDPGRAVFLDGVSQTMGPFIGPAPGGDFDRIGIYSGGPADANIAEILFYDSILSTSDRQAVEQYLKTKYGTP